MKFYFKDRRIETCGVTLRAGEINSEVFTFCFRRNSYTYDLSSCLFYLCLSYPDGQANKKQMTKNVSEEEITADWIVSEDDAACEGKLRCQISIENNDGSYVMKSEIFEIGVSESVDVTEAFNRVYSDGIYGDITGRLSAAELGISNLVTDVESKVTAEEGKGLSTNDFSDYYKNKLTKAQAKSEIIQTAPISIINGRTFKDIVLADNREYYLGSSQGIRIGFLYLTVGFTSFFSFDCVEDATSIIFITSGNRKWTGTDCDKDDGFMPIGGKHYEVVANYDGFSLWFKVNGWEV